jgi:hypothetical protein
MENIDATNLRGAIGRRANVSISTPRELVAKRTACFTLGFSWHSSVWHDGADRKRRGPSRWPGKPQPLLGALSTLRALKRVVFTRQKAIANL